MTLTVFLCIVFPVLLVAMLAGAWALDQFMPAYVEDEVEPYSE